MPGLTFQSQHLAVGGGGELHQKLQLHVVVYTLAIVGDLPRCLYDESREKLLRNLYTKGVSDIAITSREAVEPTSLGVR